MSAPATTTRVSTTARAPTAPVASTARATTPVATSVAAVTSKTQTHRQRTTTITTASSIIPTVVPFSPAEEQQADARQTNKILIGIFTSLGVILLGLVAFQLFRCYKRRYTNRNVPLPPPRESQVGYHSRAVSMYGEYPKDLSRPPSMMRHGSASGLITPSIRSNAPSMDIRVDEAGRMINDPSRAPGDTFRDDSPNHSLTGPPLVPNDEETGRRRSPLGSRSESPSNLSPPRPPSQAQVNPRARPARSNSAANQRHSSYYAPGSVNRSSTYDPSRRASFYASGNSAPHSPHARVGLVMPQPLARESFNYTLNGRHDQGSRGNLSTGSEQDNQPLAPPRILRPDSWVVNSHSSTSSLNSTPVTSDAPTPLQKDGSLPRGRRTSRAENPQS